MMNVKGLSGTEIEYIRKHHQHEITDNQCNSFLIKHIKAPIHLVWSLVRRFDQPQKYKPFVSRCVVQGNLEIGSLREVDVKSGLPATTSTERLELLDDEEHILSVRIVGGDHRLRAAKIQLCSGAWSREKFNMDQDWLVCLTDRNIIPLSEKRTHLLAKSIIIDNYASTVSVHPEVIEGRPGTMVIESFVVDVPEGNTKDETCFFVEALIKCNLKSLADVSESLAVQDRTEPVDHD